MNVIVGVDGSKYGRWAMELVAQLPLVTAAGDGAAWA